MKNHMVWVALALAVAAVIAPARSARAWGDNGHIAVAKVADLNLEAKARTAVEKLLGPGVHIYDRKIAMFADTFRFTAAGSFTRNWHFVDIPLDADAYDPARDCDDQDCVVFRIEDLKKTLADPCQSTPKRAFALKMLVHLVGDLHQPLHAATRLGADGTSDNGGNKVPVLFLGHREGHLNLHHIWDSEILDRNLGGADPEDFGTALNDKITEAQRDDWSAATDAETWANQSHAEARAHAYQDIPPLASIDARHPVAIPQGYVDQASPVVNAQISKAGIRLARLLNDALK